MLISPPTTTSPCEMVGVEPSIALIEPPNTSVCDPIWNVCAPEFGTGGVLSRVTGDLTIRGVSKPVTIECEYTGTADDPFGNTRVGFEGSATIDRRDFGVTWNAALGTGGVLISEKITLEIDVSLIKAS